MAIEGRGDSKGTFSATLDALGHVVGESSHTEDGETEEVNLKLSDSSPGSQFTCTSRRIMGLDFLLVKE